MQRRDYSKLVGCIFGRWTVVGVPQRSPYTPQRVMCLCECGGARSVQVKHLESGKSQSCGCLHKEKVSEVGKGNTREVEGYPSHLHPLYMTWAAMKDRCLREKATGYKNYGGRGIAVCERWLGSFSQFVQDMGERPEGHTLDRIDNDGNYEPSNCKWSTSLEQNRNRRFCKSEE